MKEGLLKDFSEEQIAKLKNAKNNEEKPLSKKD